MKSFKRSYFQLNPYSLLIRWPEKIDREILFDMVSFKNLLDKEHPSFISHSGYHELLVRTPQPIANVNSFTTQLDDLYARRSQSTFTRSKYYLPVCYDAMYGEDLPELCEILGLSEQELIQLHTQNSYTVYTIGFLPGFMYLGGLDERLFCDRKNQPRERVPKGSVGIGGKQTGIYPQESPGGWQLIGNCPVQLFQVEKRPPFFAQVGDEIVFYAIEKEEYEHIQVQVATGIYQLKKEACNDEGN